MASRCFCVGSDSAGDGFFANALWATYAKASTLRLEAQHLDLIAEPEHRLISGDQWDA